MTQPVRKTAGILGGMGPYATAMFFRRVLDLTPAEKDWDHIHMVIDNHPHIPSRTRHILYGEESPVPGMIDACNRLAAYPVDFIAVPCNSACYFLDDVTPHVSVPVLNIITETVRAIPGSGMSCAVLGGRVTTQMRSYAPALEQAGHSCITHDEEVQAITDCLIESVKTNQVDADTITAYTRLLERLRDEFGATVMILGCTELTLFPRDLPGLDVIDSTDELAKTLVAQAGAAG